MEGKKELYLALIKARAEVPTILKKKTGAHNAKYEDLVDVYDIIIPVLTENNLFIESKTEYITSEITLLHMRICHAPSEQALDWATLSLKACTNEDVADKKGDVNDAKRNKDAGNQTYWRRYLIKLIFGICGEKDDQDGYAVPSRTYGDRSEDTRPISEAQGGFLRRKMNSNAALESQICKSYNIRSLLELQRKDMDEVLGIIDKLNGKEE